MLLPLVFAAAAPTAFVQAVEHRIAGTQMHVTDWWQDDLDGDHVPEQIAAICSDEAGFYLVQRGKDLLEAPWTIDGRNSCPPPGDKPAWHVEGTGSITETINVHHGFVQYVLAIRNARLVTIAEHDTSHDTSRSGSEDEYDDLDYEALTWSHRIESSRGRVKAAKGPLLVVTDVPRRPVKLAGTTTVAAIRADGGITLHVHADRALTVRDCTSSPCTAATKIGKGDSEVTIPDAAELVIAAGKTKLTVHVQALEADQAYPPPAAAM